MNMFRLPVEAYTSQDWFDKEKIKIFGHTWQFAGFVDDLKVHGDHLCVQAGDAHIMVVKDENGQLNAIHTACRHRGNRIDTVSGNSKKLLKCPYHSWSYNLNGELTGVPEFGALEPFDKKDYGLKKAGLKIWKTMILVNPDPNATDFDTWIRGVEQYMGPHKPELLVEYKEKNNLYLCNCNWKLFAENYMDGYHLEYLHSETLNMYDHKLQKSHYLGPHWTFFEPLVEAYKNNLTKYGYTPIDHIPDQSVGAYVHLLFPNLGITESESTWTILRILPLKPNLTLLEYRAKVMPADAKHTGWFGSAKNSDNKKGTPIQVSDYDKPLESMDFMIEDMYVCENIQRSMEAGYFKAGPMHITKESSISNFQQAVLDHMIK